MEDWESWKEKIWIWISYLQPSSHFFLSAHSTVILLELKELKEQKKVRERSLIVIFQTKTGGCLKLNIKINIKTKIKTKIKTPSPFRFQIGQISKSKSKPKPKLLRPNIKIKDNSKNQDLFNVWSLFRNLHTQIKSNIIIKAKACVTHNPFHVTFHFQIGSNIIIKTTNCAIYRTFTLWKISPRWP